MTISITELVDSWQTALEAERKSPETIASYKAGVTAYLGWLKANNLPDEIDRRAAQAWVKDLLAGGAEASTARARLLAVRRFSVWLAAEDEIPEDPLLGMKSPKIDSKVVEPMTADELRAMLKTCGRDFLGIRDAALIRFMAETTARAGEVVAMDLADLDIRGGTAILRRGKGGKGRIVPFGAQTAAALDRYVRHRRLHKHASSPRLWLGHQGPGFAYGALRKTLQARAKAAGVEGFRPHKTRHTAATRWLAAGGSEGGLMAIAGWKQRSMLDRYVRATASARAAEEAKGLNLGEL